MSDKPDTSDPRFWGIDLGQLERIEQRAREKLQAAGIAVPAREQLQAGAAIPLPKPCDNVVWSLLAHVIYEARALRVLLAADRMRDASECMTRIRHNMDDAAAVENQPLADERRAQLAALAAKKIPQAERDAVLRRYNELEGEPSERYRLIANERDVKARRIQYIVTGK